MNHDQYLFSQLLCLYDEEFKNAPYDEQYYLNAGYYNAFEKSKYNVDTKSAFDCIQNYLESGEHKNPAVSKIEEAKKTLRDAGYFVDDLWNVIDVYSSYECSKETAFKILENALTSEQTMEHMWSCIGDEIDKIQH